MDDETNSAANQTTQTKAKGKKKKNDDTVDDTNSVANQTNQTIAKKNPLLVMEVVIPEDPVDSLNTSSGPSSSSSRDEDTEVEEKSGKGTPCSLSQHNKVLLYLKKRFLNS